MFKILKLFLASFLIISFVVPFVAPRPVSAASAPINIAVCTGAGLLANYLTGLISDAIGGGLAVPVSEGGLRTKEGALDVAARCVARQLFDGGISGILNTVRTSGRDGSAAYVKDWRNFITSAEYRGEDIFRGILSNTKLCDYIDEDIKNVFGVINKTSLPTNVQTRVGNLDPYQLRASCTMPSGFNLDDYKKDFVGNGGWQAFSRLLQPQNNYFGSLFGALDESAKQRELEKSADTNEAVSGEGYTSKRDACQSTGGGARCVVLGKVLTPGSTLSKAVNSTFQSELDWLANSDELNEVIATLIERFINRLLDISAEDIEQQYAPDPEVPLPEPNPGSGLSCEQKGMTNFYEEDVSAAISVVANSTNLDDGSKDDDEALGRFLDAVVIELRSKGFRAGRVNNGRLRNDTVIVGRDGDTDGSVYDIISGADAPGQIGGSLVTQCVDHGSWSWLVEPGAGGGVTNDEPNPNLPPTGSPPGAIPTPPARGSNVQVVRGVPWLGPDGKYWVYITAVASVNDFTEIAITIDGTVVSTAQYSPLTWADLYEPGSTHTFFATEFGSEILLTSGTGVFVIPQ